VRVLLEPAVPERAALPPAPLAVPEPLPAPVLQTPLTRVRGGSSFTTAAELAPGSSEDTALAGETLYFRVPVQWGQRLAYTVSVPPAQPGARTVGGAPLRAFLAGPSRRQVELLDGGDTSDYFGGRYDADGASVGGSTAPVLFRNRDVDEDALETASLAGDHYLVVQVGTASGSDDDVPLPLRIGVEVVGEASGAPSYASLPDAAEDAAGEQQPQDDAPTGDAGQDGAAQDGGAQDGAGQDGAAAAGSSDSTGVDWRTVGYTGGGVAALALAGALLLAPLLRGRRRGAPRPRPFG
jgi:Ca-activated chloride channel family protein